MVVLGANHYFAAFYLCFLYCISYVNYLNNCVSGLANPSEEFMVYYAERMPWCKYFEVSSFNSRGIRLQL